MEYWIWLSQLKGIGSITQKKLLEHFFSPEAIYDATKQQLMEVDGIGPALTEVIKSSSLEKAEGILEKVNKGNIKILTYEDSFYPMKAKLYPEAPILLYYRGNLRQNSVGVGIVGARRCSAYGKEVTREAATFLAKNNIPVISGMAKGIDGYAHIACLKADGYTLAFLGSGVDICYPKEHDELMGRILEKGAILSEYPPGTKPKPEYFPKRNALISAWSEKLLVVEAGEKSGALITATLSEALHREVWAVPNTIYSQMGKGTNNLIASGAKIYLKPEQLMVGEE
ncbi:MAG: DNA-processing protein DprA, partial [Clostridiaceae bacterium]|nr:DNA-processing protein DprA [Clostridiaceae bacterium]